MPDHPFSERDDHGSRRRPRPRVGSGLVWLVADPDPPGFGCYWYGGRSDGLLWEHERAGSADDAVTWGRARSGRVRLQASDGRTSWAGPAVLPGETVAP